MSRRAVVAVVFSLVVVAGALGLTGSVGALHASSSDGAAPSISTTAPATAPTSARTTAVAPSVAPSVASRTAFEDSVLRSAAADGVPQKDLWLPNFDGGGRMVGSVVSPITGVAPAPMGLGDFGVRNTTGTPTSYVLNSQSWEGTVTLNSGDFFYLDNDGPDTFGIQLNTVLTNVTVWGHSRDDFWTQDVMFFTP
ncbi:MAG TPA: thermopsin family protease, partial [Thermoplasmata archaeon]|nr:thermopsin family protease [Thermoplasmata archaeon]